MEIPKFTNHDQLLDFLVENKSTLIEAKKKGIKHADSVCYQAERNTDKASPMSSGGSSLMVKSVINTTNILDSHGDVHIKGLWKKSLNEQKNFMLLQEHQMRFDKIISDEVKAFTEEISFRKLGFYLPGETQALIFDSVIPKDRNPFMFDQYAKGWVKNHSVGMQYVKLYLAVNSDSDEFKEEAANWEKYISEVANRKQAEQQGYFFAVTEAKILEGSAVPVGSNTVTPTLSIESKENEPLENDTQKTEPSGWDTQKRKFLY